MTYFTALVFDALPHSISRLFNQKICSIRPARLEVAKQVSVLRELLVDQYLGKSVSLDFSGIQAVLKDVVVVEKAVELRTKLVHVDPPF